MQMHRILLGLGLVAFAAAPATAQSDRNWIFMARGGGFTALEDFRENAPTIETKTGFTVGAGVGYQLSKNFVVRVDGDYARDELEVNGVDTGDKMNRYFYGAALQLQLPLNGWTPYVLGGGGGVTLDQPGGESKTKGQGTFGAGVKLDLGDSPWGVFVEGRGYVYKAKSFSDGPLAGVNKTQFDLGWTAGLSFSL